MSPRKLTDDNRKEILKLYRQTAETTSTLAIRYGVSSSTISRFLKSNLSELEYEDLIQQKRLCRTPKSGDKEVLETVEQPVESESDFSDDQTTSPVIRRRRRSSAPSETIIATPVPEEKTPARTLQKVSVKDEVEFFEQDEDVERVDVITLGEMLGEDLADLDEDEEDLEDIDEDEWEDEVEADYPHTLSKNADVQVLPLSEASFPNICYLVIDRAAELITRPLKEFADLGKIPAEEVQQKTLPVFDNHRVARRFSNRSQRVIKVPDGRMLEKTCSYLQAKGITRLLIDGQVYSLSSF
ncbi:MAG: transposase [Xenococcaceae cyanobacterium]